MAPGEGWDGAGETTETKATQRKPWFFGDEAPQETVWLVDGLIPTQSCLVMGAEEKTGKTWLCGEIAIAIAQGGVVLDTWRVSEPGTVLLVSPEGSQRGLRRRLWGMTMGRGIAGDDAQAVSKRIPIWPGKIDLNEDTDVKALWAAVEFYQPALLIIDPLITATAGNEENDNGGMQRFLNIIRELRFYCSEMSIIVAHHVNKNHADRSPWHALRGASALGAWADGLITLRRASDDSDAERRIDVWHRDDPSPEPVGFVIDKFDDPEIAFKLVRLLKCDAPDVGRSAPKEKTNKAELLRQTLHANAGSLDLVECEELLGVRERQVRTYASQIGANVSKGRVNLTIT